MTTSLPPKRRYICNPSRPISRASVQAVPNAQRTIDRPAEQRWGCAGSSREMRRRAVSRLKWDQGQAFSSHPSTDDTGTHAGLVRFSSCDPSVTGAFSLHPQTQICVKLYSSSSNGPPFKRRTGCTTGLCSAERSGVPGRRASTDRSCTSKSPLTAVAASVLPLRRRTPPSS